MTGATVSPALYIACGISGASQHLVGMRGSGFVIAINTDVHAPIFREADICIIEDLKQFIPLVLETYEKRKADNETNQRENR
jgi:electron transfer flavoprotein alpha subunit